MISITLRESKLHYLFYFTVETWGVSTSYSFYFEDMKDAIKMLHMSIDFTGMAAILEDDDEDGMYYKLMVINDRGDLALEGTIQRLNHCKYI